MARSGIGANLHPGADSDAARSGVGCPPPSEAPVAEMPDHHEIHMFSAVAEATADAPYAAGECHPMLIFVRQVAGSEHDLAAAAAAAAQQGWIEIDITRAGTLPPDAGESMEEPLLGAYRDAVENGRGLTVFEATVRPAPRKA